jgi:hypothetical protein
MAPVYAPDTSARDGFPLTYPQNLWVRVPMPRLPSVSEARAARCCASPATQPAITSLFKRRQLPARKAFLTTRSAPAPAPLGTRQTRSRPPHLSSACPLMANPQTGFRIEEEPPSVFVFRCRPPKGTVKLTLHSGCRALPHLIFFRFAYRIGKASPLPRPGLTLAA